MRIIVGANVAKFFKKPGAVDNRMTYVLGLRRLGHEVYLVDDRGSSPLFNEDSEQQSLRSWQGTLFFETATRRYGIWPDCSLLHGEERSAHGLSYSALIRFAESADLLLNLHGRIEDPEIFERIPVRAYIDHDPGLTQVYKAVYDVDRRLSGHHAYFTFGLNIGTARSEIPDCGLDWQPIGPPVVLDWWPVATPATNGRYTTISKWAGAQTFEFQGRYSGEKSDNWRKFKDVPRRTSEELEIALAIHPDWTEDIRALEESGWILSDPGCIRTYDDYAAFIRRSRGEFSIANNRLVEFNTGGISDRTVRYLASGRPAVVQSTGFEGVLPTGEGLLTFSTVDEAVDRLEAVAADYPRHCKAAREIAEEFFDSDKVLTGMLERLGLEARVAGVPAVHVRAPESPDGGLRGSAELVFGADVVSLRSEPSKWATLFPAEILTVTLAGGETLSSFVKRLGAEEEDHPEKQRRDREVRIYEKLLGDPSLPVARFYGAVPTEEGHDVFLEHVDGWNLKHHHLEHWFAAARRLADLHAHFALRRDALLASDFLLRFDAAYFTEWAERSLGGVVRQAPVVQARLRRVVERYPLAAEFLTRQPDTLVHNDPAPKNVIAVPTNGTARICFVDWEMAGIGCGLLDLVHLKYGLDPPDDERMRAEYVDALAGTGLLPEDPDELDALFDACELHKTLYRLSFAETWGLPGDLVAGWVQEAEELLSNVRSFAG